MTQSFSLDLNLANVLAGLDQDAVICEEAARPAAQAGAQVLYDAVRANVASMRKLTGNLGRSIYQAHSPEKSQGGLQVYNISWNARKAPHGHLLEWGWLQRYMVYQGNDGRIRTMVRPGMDGTPRPGRRASRAEKDAYYVPLPGGPRQVAGKAFVRSAQSRFPQAQAAMEAEYVKQLKARGVIR